MQLFLIAFLPGLLICWLYFRNRESWLHAIIAMILGAVTSYGVIYVLGNYVQTDQIAEMNHLLGDELATDMTNMFYGNALKSAVGTIVATAIAMKLKKRTASRSG